MTPTEESSPIASMWAESVTLTDRSVDSGAGVHLMTFREVSGSVLAEGQS